MEFFIFTIANFNGDLFQLKNTMKILFKKIML